METGDSLWRPLERDKPKEDEAETQQTPFVPHRDEEGHHRVCNPGLENAPFSQAFSSPGDTQWACLLLVAPGRSAHRSALSAVRPLHDQPQRTAGQDPADPHVPAEHPQHLELPSWGAHASSKLE